MWFFGLIIGAILGSIGDARGALLGAIVGAGVAWALSQKSRGPGEERLEKLESAIHVLQQRVSFLENDQRPTARVDEAPSVITESTPASPANSPANRKHSSVTRSVRTPASHDSSISRA